MDYFQACWRSARAGGDAISDIATNTYGVQEGSFVGHHAIVTDADFISQASILRTIRRYDSEAWFITEEHVEDEAFGQRIVRSGDLDTLSTRCVYIIDELDGTSSRKRGHHEWSTSVGYVDNLVHKAGAVYAPKIEGGTLFAASRDEGGFVEVNGERRCMSISECSNLKDAYVLFGPDVALKQYPVHNRLFLELGDTVRTVNINGSCALGLGLVAAGRADALVQPLQSPWDWAAGKLLVEEAGGKVLFYEMKPDDPEKPSRYINIMPVNRLEPCHYNPDTRAVGFIAGPERIVDEILEMILRIKV